MEFVDVENSRVRASRIGLGTWAIGGWMWGGSDDAGPARLISISMRTRSLRSSGSSPKKFAIPLDQSSWRRRR